MKAKFFFFPHYMPLYAASAGCNPCACTTSVSWLHHWQLPLPLSLSVHSIITLCTNTVILKVFQSVCCVVVSVGTMWTVWCGGSSNRPPAWEY